jgi:hypothetical protein
MSDKEKKEIEKFDPRKSPQLNMFELLDSSLKDYSNSIELYDTMPKYFIGGAKRVKDKVVESLPILSREFVHRNKPYKLDLSPAAVLDKKTGKTIHYYPSQREELVEDALRKIATKGRAKEFDKDGEKRVGVTFTYYEVQQELEKMGHGYSIAEIKLAIEILSKAVLEITSKDDSISITNNFFSFVGKETRELGGKERVVVIFHTLVTKSINIGNYRLFNYDKLMKMKMPLSRWLHKRISHMFSQATIFNPYEIKLSTIVRDSGMKSYKTISERARQIEKSLDELKDKEISVINKWEKQPETEKNKILDIKYSLYMSEEFVADAKKANSLTNLRLKGEEVAAPYNIEDLRKEMEKPIYGLTKTVINNTISKIKSREEYDVIIKALEAAIDYIEYKKSKNEIISNAAITKKAIQEEWEPKSKSMPVVSRDGSDNSAKMDEEEIKLKEEQRLAELEKRKEDLKHNQMWKKIKIQIKQQWGEEILEKWFENIEGFSEDKGKVILFVQDKFRRDWIIREFIDQKSGYNNQKSKSLKDLITEVYPDFKQISILVSEN